ncbi:hypothetical protein GLU60_01390 [Nanohaloarchaea archaeon H01]|nr:hypothetical protein [Nanohaloarchaea archaeon H01]
MSMKIQEEVVRRRQTIAVEAPERVYSEIRDLLERRMSFDEVIEEKYYTDVEEGNVRSRLETVEGFDKHTIEQLEVFLVINKNSQEVDIQVKGKLVTEYPISGWKGNLWYYAYRALYEKFLYGEIRHEWEHEVEEKVEEFFERTRQTLEVH